MGGEFRLVVAERGCEVGWIWVGGLTRVREPGARAVCARDGRDVSRWRWSRRSPAVRVTAGGESRRLPTCAGDPARDQIRARRCVRHDRRRRPDRASRGAGTSRATCPARPIRCQGAVAPSSSCCPVWPRACPFARPARRGRSGLARYPPYSRAKGTPKATLVDDLSIPRPRRGSRRSPRASGNHPI